MEILIQIVTMPCTALQEMYIEDCKEADRGKGLQIGDSLRAIQVRSHVQEHSVCFHLMRSDGTVEDFSTNKCIASLFPAWSASHAAKVGIPTEWWLCASKQLREG